jgi:hypothetical protein
MRTVRYLLSRGFQKLLKNVSFGNRKIKKIILHVKKTPPTIHTTHKQSLAIFFSQLMLLPFD